MGEGKPSTSEAGFFLSQALTFSQHGLGLHPKTPRSDIEITNLEHKKPISTSFVCKPWLATKTSLSSASRCDESALKSHLKCPRGSENAFKSHLNCPRSFGSAFKSRLNLSHSSENTNLVQKKLISASFAKQNSVSRASPCDESGIKSHLNPSRSSGNGFKWRLNPSRRSENALKSRLNPPRGFARGNFITEIRRHGCGGGTK